MSTKSRESVEKYDNCQEIMKTTYKKKNHPNKIAHNLLPNLYLACTAGMHKTHTPTISKEKHESQEI
jgi:hypothetical protein